jgi:transposase
VLAKSALGQATTYTLHQWPKLRRCLDYAEVELSNNLAENSMRPVALGRNYVRAMIMCSPPVSSAA